MQFVHEPRNWTEAFAFLECFDGTADGAAALCDKVLSDITGCTLGLACEQFVNTACILSNV